MAAARKATVAILAGGFPACWGTEMMSRPSSSAVTDRPAMPVRSRNCAAARSACAWAAGGRAGSRPGRAAAPVLVLVMVMMSPLAGVW